MKIQNHNFLSDDLIYKNALNFVASVEDGLQEIIRSRTNGVLARLQKVLKAFSDEGLGVHHFQSLNGYGHGDLGRELIDNVFAKVFVCEKAAVRMQFVSGTHAISSALFGVLRPGDNLLSVTGKPYETLEEVIGLRGKGQGSLLEFDIKYDQISIFNNGIIDLNSLRKALKIPRKMAFIQRSCGYSWRPSLSIKDISDICMLINDIQDPLFDWPLSSQQFEQYILNKYGSVESAQTTTKYYYQTIRAEVEKTGIRERVPEVKYIVDSTTYDSLAVGSRSTQTEYEWEEELNDEKRNIKIINESFIQELDFEVKKSFV